MTSPVDLANQALAEASSRSNIASLSEDSSEAVAANTFFVPVRDQVFRAARWNCARKTALLTLLKAAPGTPENANATYTTWSPAYPPPPWFYTYAYPSDCEAMWMVLPQSTIVSSGVPMFAVGQPSLWNGMGQIGGWNDGRLARRFMTATDDDLQGNPERVVCTNESQAIGVYCRIVDNPTIWDPLLQEAFVQALAGKLAIAVSGDKAMAQIKMKAANDAILRARVADANEGVTTTDRDADWVTARSSLSFATLPGSLFGAYGPLFSVL